MSGKVCFSTAVGEISFPNKVDLVSGFSIEFAQITSVFFYAKLSIESITVYSDLKIFKSVAI